MEIVTTHHIPTPNPKSQTPNSEILSLKSPKPNSTELRSVVSEVTSLRLEMLGTKFTFQAHGA